jgi:hypothetical protein
MTDHSLQCTLSLPRFAPDQIVLLLVLLIVILIPNM